MSCVKQDPGSFDWQVVYFMYITLDMPECEIYTGRCLTMASLYMAEQQACKLKDRGNLQETIDEQVTS